MGGRDDVLEAPRRQDLEKFVEVPQDGPVGEEAGSVDAVVAGEEGAGELRLAAHKGHVGGEIDNGENPLVEEGLEGVQSGGIEGDAGIKEVVDALAAKKVVMVLEPLVEDLDGKGAPDRGHADGEPVP